MVAQGGGEVVPKRQRELRNACIRGDVEAVKRLLLPRQLPRWQRALKFLCGPALLHSLGIETCTDVARLDYVYCDDNANLAIHYIAKGQAALLPRFMRWVLLGQAHGSVGGCGSAEARAALLRYLFTEVVEGRQEFGGVCLGAVNGSLETPLHCAIRSSSTQVVEQLLHLGLAATQGTSAIQLKELMVLRYGRAAAAKLSMRHVEEFMVMVDCMDEKGAVPLDLAVSLSQWSSVRVLLAAGAHEGYCPGMRSAKTQLARWTSKLVSPSVHTVPAEQVSPGSVVAGVAKLSKSLFGGMGGRLFKMASLAVGYDSTRNPLLEEAEEEDRVEWAEEGDISAENDTESKAVVYNSTAEVAQRQETAAEHVACVIGVNLQAASALLAAHGGHAEATIQAYLSDSRDACAAAGLSEAHVISDTAAPPPSTPVCIVCFDDLTLNEDYKIVMACGHVCCDRCWLGLLTARLDDGDVHRAVCPAEGCQLPLPLSSACSILPSDMYERYSRLVGQKAVDISANLKWCPNPTCQRSLELASDKLHDSYSNIEIECECGHRFCWSCSQPPHQPASCELMADWQRLMRAVVEEAEEHTQNWMSTATKACPRCGARIQKTGGCNHMSCRNCSHDFCWMCMGDWRLHNAQTGGYYSCSLEQNQESQQPGNASSVEGQDTTSAVPTLRSLDPQGLIQGICRAVQMPFRNMRLAHHMRRYSQHTQYDLQAFVHAATEIGNMWEIAGLHCTGDLSVLCCKFLGTGHTSTEGQTEDMPRESAVGQGLALMMLLASENATSTSIPAKPSLSALATESTSSTMGSKLLDKWAREVAAAHALLGHSYVLGWFMAWGRCRRYLEHLQGELEASVDAATIPLSTFPRQNDASLLMQQLTGRLGHRGNYLQVQQFYHSLVVYHHLPHVLMVLCGVRKQTRGLLRKARRGVFETAHRAGDECPSDPSFSSKEPAVESSTARDGASSG